MIASLQGWPDAVQLPEGASSRTIYKAASERSSNAAVARGGAVCCADDGRHAAVNDKGSRADGIAERRRSAQVGWDDECDHRADRGDYSRGAGVQLSGSVTTVSD